MLEDSKMHTINIEKCKYFGYKLTGRHIKNFYEEALNISNKKFLDCYSKIYKGLMFEDFNALWQSKPANKLDPLDSFWNVNYTIFNISIIELILKQYKVNVHVNKDVYNKEVFYIFKFCRLNNIDINFNKLKAILMKFFELKGEMNSRIKILKKLLISTRNIGRHDKKIKKENAKTAYLYVYNNAKSLSSYIKWRYKDIIKELKKNDFRIILFSSTNIKGSNKSEDTFINTTGFLGVSDFLRLGIKSFRDSFKIKKFIRKEKRLNKKNVVYSYILKQSPSSLLLGLKNSAGFERMVRLYGKGILLNAESLVNKKFAIYNSISRNYKIKTIAIAGRVLTKQRLSNRLVKAHIDNSCPKAIPDSIMVFDKISQQVLKKESHGKINVYSCQNKNETIKKSELRENIQSVAVLLQKPEDNMQNLIDHVLDTLKGMGDIKVYIKMHPNFPMPEHLKNRYSKLSSVIILPINERLEKVVSFSDICVTSYSTAALEFAKAGKLIIWAPYVTLNSVFYKDLQDKIGLKAEDKESLENIFESIVNDKGYYKKKSEENYKQIKNLLFNGSVKQYVLTKTEVIEKEYSKL